MFGGDHHSRLRLGNQAHGISALQFLQRCAHRILKTESPVHLVLDQVGDHFRVRLAPEGVLLVVQFLFQGQVILYDAVVNQHHRSGLVRMGIDLGRFAVGGPAGVADGDGPLHRHGRQQPYKIFKLALAPSDLGLTILNGADAG
jgi:hypothetical protein